MSNVTDPKNNSAKPAKVRTRPNNNQKGKTQKIKMATRDPRSKRR